MTVPIKQEEYCLNDKKSHTEPVQVMEFLGSLIASQGILRVGGQVHDSVFLTPLFPPSV